MNSSTEEGVQRKEIEFRSRRWGTRAFSSVIPLDDLLVAASRVYVVLELLRANKQAKPMLKVPVLAQVQAHIRVQEGSLTPLPS
jgi:hypothetical protein